MHRIQITRRVQLHDPLVRQRRGVCPMYAPQQSPYTKHAEAFVCSSNLSPGRRRVTCHSEVPAETVDVSNTSSSERPPKSPSNPEDDVQLKVDVSRRASVQVDADGHVDAEKTSEVHMDGSALQGEEAGEGKREGGVVHAIGNTVANAAMDAIDLVAEAEEVPGPALERLKELEAKYRTVDDRLDMIERRLVELAKEDARLGGSRDGEDAPRPPAVEQQGVGLKNMNKIQSRFTEVLNSGYLESIKQLRENLMLHEWELNNKYLAQRSGISNFEVWCVERDIDVEYEVLTELYEDPVSEEALQKLPAKLRSMARASVEQSCDQRMSEVYARCTAIATQLATANTQSMASSAGSKIFNFIKRLLPFKIPFLM